MADSVLVATEVSRAFDGDIAVEGVAMSVDQGEIHAIVGLNGAGKTTLMRLMLGMIRPDAGTVTLAGTDIGKLSPAAWVTVGYLIETPFAYPELTVKENLWVASRLRGYKGSVGAALVERAIERLGLRPWEAKRARALSLGNRQRLGVGSATMHNPSIMLLDEPINALDPAGVVLIRDLLKDEAELGKGILVSSHHLDEIARVAHRITVMHRGRVVGSLDPKEADLERRFFEIVYEADREW